MDYFEKFSNVLDNNFHGDFNSLMDSKTKFDRYQGIPLRIKEIDRRKPVEPVYVVPEEPIAPDVIPDDIHFEVIDLDIEMEKRKQNTDAVKDVKVDTSVPVPAEKFSITLKRRVTKKSPRGAVIQTQTSSGIQIETVVHGNRAQRKAAAAIQRKANKHGNKGNGGNRNKNNSNTQKEDSPKRINLSDLAFGFRLE